MNQNKIIAMPPLLQRLAQEAAEPVQLTEEELLHKLFTDMCKRLDRAQLKAVCVNYHVWRAKQIISINNDKQTA